MIKSSGDVLRFLNDAQLLRSLNSELITQTDQRLPLTILLLLLGEKKVCKQGRSEGTSSVAFEVLIINCQIYFINLFIFNCFNIKHKTVHLQVV